MEHHDGETEVLTEGSHHSVYSPTAPATRFNHCVRGSFSHINLDWIDIMNPNVHKRESRLRAFTNQLRTFICSRWNYTLPSGLFGLKPSLFPQDPLTFMSSTWVGTCPHTKAVQGSHFPWIMERLSNDQGFKSNWTGALKARKYVIGFYSPIWD